MNNMGQTIAMNTSALKLKPAIQVPKLRAATVI